MKSLGFSLFAGGDAYSTDKKIMGRQSAGKSLIRGIAKYLPNTSITTLSQSPHGAQSLFQQLKENGWSGQLRGTLLSQPELMDNLQTLYYPAPPDIGIAWWRARQNPKSFSLMGITHTMSTQGATEQISNLCLPPYHPWDGLICTSQVALTYVKNQLSQLRDFYQTTLDAKKFNFPELRVIPLGINVNDFSLLSQNRLKARQELQIEDDAIVILSAGRLSFHAKQNPAPLYQALEVLSQKKSIVVIEAGIHFNEHIQKGFLEAQAALAPHVKFIHVQGQSEAAYQASWAAADIFVSLSDNIQETFGITPIEAMACGLPVIVSDWDGYKDTVEHGKDGYRISTYLSAPGTMQDLAWRQDIGLDTPDMYIGRVSLATALNLEELKKYLEVLIESPQARRDMGEKGQKKAFSKYNWSNILDQYADFANDLNVIRSSPSRVKSYTNPIAIDPSYAFKHYASDTIDETAKFIIHPQYESLCQQFGSLAMSNYGGSISTIPNKELINALAKYSQGVVNYQELASMFTANHELAARSMMWLLKFGIIKLVTN